MIFIYKISLHNFLNNILKTFINIKKNGGSRFMMGIELYL